MVSGPLLLVLIGAAVALIVLLTAVVKLHPFLALLLATLALGLAVGLEPSGIITAINGGFGGLMGYIGLIVVLGSIIGVILEKSGAALRIADLILRVVGKKRPALAMTIVGATVSIPVFCDSGFIILSGLNDALARRTGAKKATLALALASGLYTTHTLIPPTPGPIAAAGNLGAGDYLGTIMLLGFAVSLPTAAVAYGLARRFGKNITTVPSDLLPELDRTELPSAGRSLLPILLPIVLIGMGSLVQLLFPDLPGANWLLFVGHPLVALLLGLGCALTLLPAWNETHLSGWIGEGIKLAGPILIITGAGGAFGGVLKATPLRELVEGWTTNGGFAGGWFLLVAFAIAALLKTAQGSSTNALVITSSLLAPVAAEVGFTDPTQLALLVLSIGGGAMTVSHVNDSYFWVVSQFSGISTRDAYRSFTVVTGAQGIMVLTICLILYVFLIG